MIPQDYFSSKTKREVSGNKDKFFVRTVATLERTLHLRVVDVIIVTRDLTLDQRKETLDAESPHSLIEIPEISTHSRLS